MAFFDKTAHIQQWFYEVKSIKVVEEKDGKEVTICDIPNERMISFHINEDFENMYFPLFSVTLALESDRYYKIMSAKETCKMYLRIDKLARNDMTEDMLLRRDFINGKFEMILDKTDVNFDEWLDEREDISNYMMKVVNSHNNPKDIGRPIQFYLFPEVVGNTKKNVNKIFTDCTIADALTWLFYNSGIGNVLMPNPDNNKVYKELIIPPLSTLKSLSYLDTYYGIFKPGSLIYFGLWYNYIIPYDGRNHVLPEGDKKSELDFLIPKFTTRFSSGDVKKDDSPSIDYIMANSKGVNIVNASISNDYIVANNIESTDTYENVTKVLASDAKKKKYANFTRYFENGTENEYLPFAYVAQTNAMSDIVTFNIANSDISKILPHKRFNVIFEDSNYSKEYKGNYILSSINSDFLSKGVDFSVVTSVVLKKSTLEIK